MKKILGVAVIVAALSLSNTAQAQDTTSHRSTVGKVSHGIKKGAKKAWKGTRKGAKTVGNKTAELATTGKAKITDNKSNEWVGPQGQAIFVDDGTKYYWINKKGGRVFVSKDELKPKQ